MVSETQIQDEKARAAEELNYKEETVFKPKELDQEQKKYLDATYKNAEGEFEGLTKENIVPLGDRLLVKVVGRIKTDVGIVLPSQTTDTKQASAKVDYCEIVAISPKIKDKFLQAYPNADIGWRCKLNVNLAAQVCNGPCLVEKTDMFINQYFVVGEGLIDYIYPPPAK